MPNYVEYTDPLQDPVITKINNLTTAGGSFFDKVNSSLTQLSNAFSNLKISPTVNATVNIPSYIYIIAFGLLLFGVWGIFKRR